MPKRIIDYDALWSSQKLERCPEWARIEYLWIYGLADANGVFEMTNVFALWCKVCAIRPSLTLELFKETLAIFEGVGLLFSWVEKGKKYGFWTNSDKDARLPAPSDRKKYKTIGAKPLKNQIHEYESKIESRFNRDLSRDLTREEVSSRLALGLHIGSHIGLPQQENSAEKPQRVPENIPEEPHVPEVPSDTPNFQMFWDAYPNKIGESKARRVWTAIGGDALILQIINGLENWKNAGWFDDVQYVPSAARFLGEKRFQDEVHARRDSGTVKGNARQPGALHSEPGKQYPKPRVITT